MQWRNDATRYGVIAQALHWAIALGIVAQYFLAETAEEAEDAAAAPLSATDIHAALGVTILALAVVRLVWRLIEVPPERPLTMKSYEIAFARATHMAFYVLLFAVPLSGWALASAKGLPLGFLGWFDLSQFQPATRIPLPWIQGNTLSADQLEDLHAVLFNVLVGLATLHIAAALKHQFLDRDGVLRSMLP